MKAIVRTIWGVAMVAASAAAISLANSATQSNPLDRALDVVQRYSRAHQQLDVETVVQLTHPALILRLGGRQQFTSMQTELFKSVNALSGSKKGSEMLGQPSEMFHGERTLMVGVPAIRKSSGMQTTPLVYVAFSYDFGVSWSVLGMLCTDEQWLRALALDYHGTPDILGMGNPAAMASVTQKSFDEALFLKGPRWQSAPR